MIRSSTASYEQLGQAMFDLATELFPICRSVTGPGVRETLDRLQQVIPLETREIPTGTKVFDWVVPREWSIRDAYVRDETGRRVIDFRVSNLHVVNGSLPVRQTMTWHELRTHLHTLPDQPRWIPYRTCFHTEDWGFCLTHDQFQQLEHLGDRRYDVCIDASLEDGSLTYGELLLPGASDEEVLVSTHICHPSLANDNLSGIAVATYMARVLQGQKLRYSYRFLFIPATIGAITWLSLNEDHVHRIQHGLILGVVGDAGSLTYKKSRRGNATIDRAMEYVLTHSGEGYTVQEFEPFGYDQRQFCSPGFDLPVGCLMRTPNGCYPEYHTSADNLDLIRPESLASSLRVCMTVSEILDWVGPYRNLYPKCEPRLGPRGLYHAFGRSPDRQMLQKAVLWVLNFSDGTHDLIDIAERSAIPFEMIREAADLLLQHELIRGTSLSCLTNPRGMKETQHEHCLL